jgi:ligand-binding SRPBCC domain-containing protein
MIHRIHRDQIIPTSPAEVWRFFCDPRNLNVITPPDMEFEIIQGGGVEMYAGQLIEYRVQFMPGLHSQWLTEIAHVREGRYFVDEQRIGPYRFWYHEHLFDPVDGGVRMTDHVTYVVPYGILGDLLNRIWIRRRLEGIFDFRSARIDELFGRIP